MATFASISAPPLSCPRSLTHSFPCASQGRLALCKKSLGLGLGLGRRGLVLPVKCLSSGPSEDDTSSLSASSSFSSSDFTYKLCAGLGGIGLVETTYLTYLKLTNSDAFCPIGGGSCGDILNSDYAVIFGIPFVFILLFFS